MKITVKDIDLKDKTILLRCDYNVPLKDGVILDNSKILSSLDTIKYLLENNCKIIILSHLGKVKNEEDKKKYSLIMVKDELSKLLNKEIVFSPFTSGIKLNEVVNKCENGDIILVENTRFEDIPNNLESSNDSQLALSWSELTDVFVNDAFASSHRKHASTYGITKYLESVIGLSMEKELLMLEKITNNIERPYTVIMGGAKCDEKIPLIKNIINECDYLLLGGGIANTFLKALGLEVGMSLVSEKEINEIKQILINNKNKILLPIDVIVGNETNDNYINHKNINEVTSSEVIFDVGLNTIAMYNEIIEKSKTIFVNGTMGKYEEFKYSNGTKALLANLKDSNAKVYFGGGDSVSAVNSLGYSDAFEYLFTGGGATLEYLIDKNLPCLSVIKDK